MRKIDTHFQSLVVTGRDLCVRQVRLDSQQIYWMEIFTFIYCKIVLLV